MVWLVKRKAKKDDYKTYYHTNYCYFTDIFFLSFYLTEKSSGQTIFFNSTSLVIKKKKNVLVSSTNNYSPITLGHRQYTVSLNVTYGC